MSSPIEETSAQQMQALLDRQRQAYLREGEVSTAVRIDRLERAIDVLKKHDERLVEAMNADFGHRSYPSIHVHRHCVKHRTIAPCPG